MLGDLRVSLGAKTATSISLSWTNAGSEVEYHVMWTSDECPDDVDKGSIAPMTVTNHTIEGLREGSITVSATNSAGATSSDSVLGDTNEWGKALLMLLIYSYSYFFSFLLSSSICRSQFAECICSDLLQHHSPVGHSGLHSPQWRHNRLLSAVCGVG